MPSLPTLSDHLTTLVTAAAARAGHAEVLDDVEPAVPAGNPRFGDYQSNHAFRLGKALRTNPRKVAEAVTAALGEHPAVTEVTVAGPGFINFRLDDAWLAAHLAALADDSHRGLPQHGAGRTVVIDYSSPNIAKRMHVGHMRSTLIGHALHGMHAAAGWTVIADNHVGDWGTQYGMLMVAWDRWRDEQAFAADPIAELERLYVRFRSEADEAAQDEARARTAALQAGDPEARALWQRFVAVSLEEFEGVYRRLGVHFDHTLGESHYHPALPGVVERTLAAGVARHSEGAVIIPFPDDALPKMLRDTVLVIRKQDGAFLYGTTDLATLEHRRDTWQPERIVYVTDKRQQLHFAQVFDAWRRLRAAEGDTTPLPELEHVWFGTLNFAGGAMSSRKGGTVRLVDLLDQAVERARAVVDDKSGELPDDERAAIAEAVGLSAVRYADLANNPQSDVEFDLDRMLSLEGNTAPYLMYSYARLRSVQRKAGVDARGTQGLAFTAPVERELGLLLCRYPELLPQALAASKPSTLCDYLFEVANQANRFYNRSPILKAEDDATRAARLALVEATLRVLGHGLGVLGIATLDRM